MDTHFRPSMMQVNMMRPREQGGALLIGRVYFLIGHVVVGAEVRSTSPEYECSRLSLAAFYPKQRSAKIQYDDVAGVPRGYNRA